MSTVTLWLLCTYSLTYIFYAASGGEYNPKRDSIGNHLQGNISKLITPASKHLEVCHAGPGYPLAGRGIPSFQRIAAFAGMTEI
jgi:hypothetical protein